jgi:formylmethanofuran:tetrahydromethanopterin formyltransferase
MGNSITEAQMADSEEAFEGAKYTASQMVRALKKNYSDELVRRAFEAVLNESSEELFTAIYESAKQLREDSMGSFADYIRKIKPALTSVAAFGAAVQVRLSEMAIDNKIAETSWDDFRKGLIAEGIQEPDLLFMSQLYFYRLKYPKISTFEQMALPNLSSRAANMYTSYKKLLHSQQEDLIEAIKLQWYKDSKKPQPAKKSFFATLFPKQ